MSPNTTSFEVHSPLYPNLYPNDLDCTWKVVNIEDRFLLVTFQEIELDRLDELIIGYGSDKQQGVTIFTINGLVEIPNSVSIDEDAMWISFETDREGRESGFLLAVESVETFGKI